MNSFIPVSTYETSSATTTFYMIPLPKTGCEIAITRAELLQALPHELLVACMERAKAMQRSRTRKKRERKRQEHGEKELQWIE